MPNDILTFTSCQAPIAEFTMHEVAAYLGAQLNLATRYIDDVDWPERYVQLDAHQIDIGWICGAPYAKRVDAGGKLEVLAAPVMAAPRYQNAPCYFSDVVVRHDSAFATFDDLRGASWVYNEPNSHSGCTVVRWFLAQRGLSGYFFGRVAQSGAHQNSITQILNGEADASAVDSTVLDLLFERDATLRDRLRVIDVMGPSPIPPYVIGMHVAPALRHALRHALTRMHQDPAGAAILQRGQMARFVAVTDADYNRTREMIRIAARCEFVDSYAASL